MDNLQHRMQMPMNPLAVASAAATLRSIPGGEGDASNPTPVQPSLEQMMAAAKAAAAIAENMQEMVRWQLMQHELHELEIKQQEIRQKQAEQENHPFLRQIMSSSRTQGNAAGAAAAAAAAAAGFPTSLSSSSLSSLAGISPSALNEGADVSSHSRTRSFSFTSSNSNSLNNTNNSLLSPSSQVSEHNIFQGLPSTLAPQLPSPSYHNDSLGVDFMSHLRSTSEASTLNATMDAMMEMDAASSDYGVMSFSGAANETLTAAYSASSRGPSSSRSPNIGIISDEDLELLSDHLLDTSMYASPLTDDQEERAMSAFLDSDRMAANTTDEPFSPPNVISAANSVKSFTDALAAKPLASTTFNRTPTASPPAASPLSLPSADAALSIPEKAFVAASAVAATAAEPAVIKRKRGRPPLSSTVAATKRKPKEVLASIPAIKPEASVPAVTVTGAPPLKPIPSMPLLAKGSEIMPMPMLYASSASKIFVTPSQAATAATPAAGAANTANRPKHVRKVSHNAIERRYRNNINQRISDLKAVVPALNVPKPSRKPGSAAAAATSKKRKELEGEEDSDDDDEGGDDGGNLVDGIPAATKSNKATILRKATEYIVHLKNEIAKSREEAAQLRQFIEMNHGSLVQDWMAQNAMGATKMESMPSPTSSTEPQSPEAGVASQRPPPAKRSRTVSAMLEEAGGDGKVSVAGARAVAKGARSGEGVRSGIRMMAVMFMTAGVLYVPSPFPGDGNGDLGGWEGLSSASAAFDPRNPVRASGYSNTTVGGGVGQDGVVGSVLLSFAMSVWFVIKMIVLLFGVASISRSFAQAKRGFSKSRTSKKPLEANLSISPNHRFEELSAHLVDLSGPKWDWTRMMANPVASGLKQFNAAVDGNASIFEVVESLWSLATALTDSRVVVPALWTAQEGIRLLFTHFLGVGAWIDVVGGEGKPLDEMVEVAETALALLDSDLSGGNPSPSALHRLRLSLFVASSVSEIRGVVAGTGRSLRNAFVARAYLTAALGILTSATKLFGDSGLFFAVCSAVSRHLWTKGCGMCLEEGEDAQRVCYDLNTRSVVSVKMALADRESHDGAVEGLLEFAAMSVEKQAGGVAVAGSIVDGVSRMYRVFTLTDTVLTQRVAASEEGGKVSLMMDLFAIPVERPVDVKDVMADFATLAEYLRTSEMFGDVVGKWYAAACAMMVSWHGGELESQNVVRAETASTSVFLEMDGIVCGRTGGGAGKGVASRPLVDSGLFAASLALNFVVLSRAGEVEHADAVLEHLFGEDSVAASGKVLDHPHGVLRALVEFAAISWVLAHLEPEDLERVRAKAVGAMRVLLPPVARFVAGLEGGPGGIKGRFGRMVRCARVWAEV
ncbi:hypothetical protein HDU97_001087 [Phlyctochytrium planicorne]|nr:hypothetical protein HDU97_001087 [Phlyctochytrium planicorne]